MPDFSDLISDKANPLNTAPAVGGASEIRTIKEAVEGSFPNFTTPSNAVCNKTGPEIDDAPEKSQPEIISGAWNFTTEPTVSSSAVVSEAKATVTPTGAWNFTTRPTVSGGDVITEDMSSVTTTGQWNFTTSGPLVGGSAIIHEAKGSVTPSGAWNFTGTTPTIGGVNIATLNDVSGGLGDLAIAEFTAKAYASLTSTVVKVEIDTSHYNSGSDLTIDTTNNRITNASGGTLVVRIDISLPIQLQDLAQTYGNPSLYLGKNGSGFPVGELLTYDEVAYPDGSGLNYRTSHISMTRVVSLTNTQYVELWLGENNGTKDYEVFGGGTISAQVIG